ncbi:hypothetical protein ACFO1B_27045 [Dactylosporangium siamense]
MRSTAAMSATTGTSRSPSQTEPMRDAPPSRLFGGAKAGGPS